MANIKEQAVQLAKEAGGQIFFFIDGESAAISKERTRTVKANQFAGSFGNALLERTFIESAGIATPDGHYIAPESRFVSEKIVACG